jgi:hypothetical protein
MKNVIGLMAGLCFIVAQANSQTQDVISNTTTTTVTSYQGQEAPMRSKTFSKSFAADQSDKLVLSNLYGSIQVKTWNKKEVQVDVDIKSYGNTDDEAQKLLDEVSIEAAKSGDQISFRTKMDQENRNWGSGSRNGKKFRREVRIAYVVNMPASNALTLAQTYGNVTLAELSGALYAKVQYGNFTAQNLSNTNNYVSVQYGDCTIQNMNNGIIKQQYGKGLTIGTVNTLDLNAQYAEVNITTIKGNASIKQQYGTGLSIGSVDNLNLNAQYVSVNVGTIKGNATVDQQYNNLSIGSVNKLTLKSQYTNVAIAALNGDGNFDMEYNKLSISDISNNCKTLNVDGQYVAIALGFTNNYNADLSVHTSYAPAKFSDGVTTRLLNDNKDYSSTKDYSGKIGNGGNASVKIKADYGSVTLK